MTVSIESPRATVTILIISWNSWPDLERCLQSLADSDYTDCEILVGDNGSEDGSVENLRARYPEVRLHQNATNLGHTKAVNQCVRMIDSPYVLLLDADTEVPADMLGGLIPFMEARPDVSMVAPRTYNTDGSVQESARNLPSPMAALFGRQSIFTTWFPNNRFSLRYLARENLTSREPFRVEQISSACMLFRRSLFEDVGPWDEGYFGYWVDTDWCAQLGAAGKTIYCVPEFSVAHHESNDARKKRGRLRIQSFHSGAARLYRKHHTLGWLDPRSILASLALAVRGALMLAIDSLKEAAPPPEREWSGDEMASVDSGKVKAARSADPVLRAVAYDPPPTASLPVRIAEAIYRGSEFVLAAVAVIVTSPLFLLQTVLIRLDSPGPAIFSVRRAGQSVPTPGHVLAQRDDVDPPEGGFEPDKLYWAPTAIYFQKFRTMWVDSQERFPELYWWDYDLDPDEIQKMHYKLEDDPRLTRVGKWLRKLTIDELPNFLTVLRGDVRLVGPRPEEPKVVAFYSEEQMMKFTVKPGITCLSKIYGRGELSVQEQIDLDLEYVRTKSLMLDLRILLMTFLTVIKGRGAF